MKNNLIIENVWLHIKTYRRSLERNLKTVKLLILKANTNSNMA